MNLYNSNTAEKKTVDYTEHNLSPHNNVHNMVHSKSQYTALYEDHLLHNNIFPKNPFHISKSNLSHVMLDLHNRNSLHGGWIGQAWALAYPGKQVVKI